eukprot:6203903-Prymnesium_polylepis.1
MPCAHNPHAHRAPLNAPIPHALVRCSQLEARLYEVWPSLTDLTVELPMKPDAGAMAAYRTRVTATLPKED